MVAARLGYASPPRTPDLSALDLHVWIDMAQQVEMRTPNALADLRAAMCIVWSKIDMAAVGRSVRGNGRTAERSL